MSKSNPCFDFGYFLQTNTEQSIFCWEPYRVPYHNLNPLSNIKDNHRDCEVISELASCTIGEWNDL
jgi:hypothetical protein